MRQTRDYHFDLPSSSIAQSPAARRDESRLLHLRAPGSDSPWRDRGFAEIVDILPENAVLIVNDTKVIRARLRMHKQSGGAVELLLLEPTVSPQVWRCLARASKPIREGAELRVAGTNIVARAHGNRAEDGSIEVAFEGDVFALLEAHGELPLPPYIDREHGDTEADRERYQTVYAREEGAVAAPTAGLHFSEKVLTALRGRGVDIASVTLHVGLGTFAPVRVDNLDEIELHEERFAIPEATTKLISSGRPVVAVGTTVVRALESAALGDHRVAIGPGRTSIFISPGYRFRVVDHLVTNFHLPESTLLMLVCAFAGYRRTLDAYRHAVDSGYRFYSYGDAMFIEGREEAQS